MSNYKDTVDLLNKQRQLEILTIEVEGLKKRVLDSMIDKGVLEINNKNGNVKLTKKRGKKVTVRTDNAETEALETAIQTEREEMLATNAKAIYELQKQRDLADLAIQRLLTTEWVTDMEDRLKQVRIDLKKQTIREEGQQYSLQVKPSKPCPSRFVDPAWLREALIRGKSTGVKKNLTKGMILKFLDAYFIGKQFGDMDLAEAFEIRVQEHIDYWKNK